MGRKSKKIEEVVVDTNPSDNWELSDDGGDLELELSPETIGSIVSKIAHVGTVKTPGVVTESDVLEKVGSLSSSPAYDAQKEDSALKKSIALLSKELDICTKTQAMTSEEIVTLGRKFSSLEDSLNQLRDFAFSLETSLNEKLQSLKTEPSKEVKESVVEPQPEQLTTKQLLDTINSEIVEKLEAVVAKRKASSTPAITPEMVESWTKQLHQRYGPSLEFNVFAEAITAYMTERGYTSP